MKPNILRPFIKIEDGEAPSWVDEVPPDAVMIICAPFSVPLLVPDNQIGNCAACGAAIQFRPVPSTVARVCYECAPAWYEGVSNIQ